MIECLRGFFVNPRHVVEVSPSNAEGAYVLSLVNGAQRVTQLPYETIRSMIAQSNGVGWKVAQDDNVEI